MSGAGGGSGGGGTSSDATGGLAQSWGAQQLNSAQARPDDERYKKAAVYGNNPLGGAAGSSGDGGDGGGGFL